MVWLVMAQLDVPGDEGDKGQYEHLSVSGVLPRLSNCVAVGQKKKDASLTVPVRCIPKKKKRNVDGKSI